jgi:hypothetical protein
MELYARGQMTRWPDLPMTRSYLRVSVPPWWILFKIAQRMFNLRNRSAATSDDTGV